MVGDAWCEACTLHRHPRPDAVDAVLATTLHGACDRTTDRLELLLCGALRPLCTEVAGGEVDVDDAHAALAAQQVGVQGLHEPAQRERLGRFRRVVGTG